MVEKCNNRHYVNYINREYFSHKGIIVDKTIESDCQQSDSKYNMVVCLAFQINICKLSK